MQEFYDLKIEGTKLHFIPREGGSAGFEFALPEPPANHTAAGILGEIDAIKFRSCLTLFVAAGGQPVFHEALQRFFAGVPDAQTLALLQQN